jgi:hypothetical protein
MRRNLATLQLLVTLAISLCGSSLARAELRAVWALDDGTKVKQGATSHPLASGNETFSANPARIGLFGARNETVAFQLILVGGTSPTHDVRVQMEAIGPIRNGVRTSDPDQFYRARRIMLFRQHYVRVQRRSANLTWEPWSASQPKDLSGMVPDPLSPIGPTDAMSVPAGQNQGVWVDVYIPTDVEPGEYHGRLEVSVGNERCALPSCDIDVALEVLPVTLPERTSTKTMLFFSGGENDRDVMAARYLKDPWSAPLERVQALRTRHFKMGRRHRITMFIGQDSGPNDELAARLSGAIFRRDAGYEGPGAGLGQDLYSIHTYGSHDGKVSRPEAERWRDWLSEHGASGLTYFLYVHDEPVPADFPQVNRLARQARPLPSFVTHKYDPALEVDIFCTPADAYAPTTANKGREAGKRVWIYNGVRPFTGTFMIDDVAVSPRVNAWIQHKHGIERWFYWESTYYKDAQGGRGPINVWREALNFSNWSGDRLNGDGLLIYPGRDLLFPKEDRGLAGPLPSIRLKNWRRGLEDVEYLILARERGHGAFVDELLQTMLPRTLADETEAGAPVSWSDDGQSWLRARRLLAELLREGKAPPLPSEGLAAPPEPTLKRLVRKARRAARRYGRKKLALVGAGAVGVVLLPVALIVLRRRRRRSERSS